MKYFLLILISLFYTSSGAQSFHNNFEWYNTRSGLPHDLILSLYQDKEGYIWIGTSNGVSRFDGHEFLNYRNVSATSRNAWGNAIEHITQSADGKIWICSRNGMISYFEPSQGKWSSLKLNTPTSFTYLHLGKDSLILAGTYKREITLFKNNRELFRKYLHSNQVIKNIVQSGKHEYLLIASHIFTFNSVTHEIQPLIKNITSADIIGNTLFYSMGNKLYTRNLLTGSERRILQALSSKSLLICKTSDTTCVATEGDNIYEFSESGELLTYVPVSDDKTTIKKINTLFVDQNKNIWIGTDFGLYKIIKAKYRFRKFHTNSAYRKLPNDYIRALLFNKGELWAGSRNGPICRLTASGEHYQYKRSDYLIESSSIGYSDINVIYPYSNYMLAGGLAGVVFKKGNLFTTFPFHTPKGTRPIKSQVWSITSDKRGALWIGTKDSGLYIYHPASHIFKHFPLIRERTMSTESVWNILFDREGNTWLGTENGIFLAQYDSDYNMVFKHHSSFAKNKPAGNRIWHIAEDRQHGIWFGTTDGGLSYYDTGSGLFTNYGESDGLPSDAVCGMIVSESGKLWLGTMNGLAWFDPASKSVVCFYESDGLLSNDFNFKVCAYDRINKEVFFGGKEGIISFNEDDMSIKTGEANMTITHFKILGTDTFFDANFPVRLSHEQNHFSLAFSLLQYDNPQKHIYRYKLEGFGQNWNYTDDRSPTASYTNIPPGRYTFMVESGFDGNAWSGHVKTMQIIITPAFWQTYWFWIVTGLLVLAFSVIIIYRQIRLVMKRADEKHTIMQNIAELELKALQLQMNPHFIFNAVNSIQHFIMRNDELAANEYLTKFAKLMRLFLESSKTKFTSLADEIELLKLYTDIEKLRFEEKINIRIEVDKILDTNKVEIPSMFIQPFIENAVNHGLIYKQGTGNLLISFSSTTDGMLCVVDDDGIGRAGSKNIQKPGHVSRGMELINERLKAYMHLQLDFFCTLNIEDKKDLNGNPAGTKVKILFNNTGSYEKA